MAFRIHVSDLLSVKCFAGNTHQLNNDKIPRPGDTELEDLPSHMLEASQDSLNKEVVEEKDFCNNNFSTST